MPKRHLLHAFSTFDLGGPQARFLRLAKHFGDEYHHTVIAMDGRFAAEHEIAGQSYYRRYDLPIAKGRNLNNVANFRRVLKELSPDGLFTYNFGAFEWAFASRGSNIPHYHVEEGFGPQETEKRLFRRNALRWLGFKVSSVRLVVISETMREIARKEWGVRRSRSIALVNGVDTDKFTPRPGGSLMLDSDPSPMMLGTVAALRSEKNIERLLYTIKLLVGTHDIRCRIAGSGPNEDVLKSLSDRLELGDRVEFLGHLPDPADFYKSIDLFVLSSDTEQVPLSVLEAMSSGLPVVATRVGDIPRILGDAGVSAIAELSPESLAMAIRGAISPEGNLAGLGAANRQRVLSHFSAQTMYDDWRAVFESSQNSL